MPSIACLNGVFSAPEEAFVSIDDRGYVFGDGVYETLRRYDGRLWALDRHLARLDRSMKELAIPTQALAGVRAWILEASERSGLPEAVVYVQVTRGVAPRQHTFDSSLTPSVLITVRPAEPLPDQVRAAGVSCISAVDIRWARRDIKTINLLGNVLAKQAAHAAGAFEAILIEPGGRVTEGSSTNVFCIRSGEVVTAPSDHHILGGITRDLVLAVSRRLGVNVREEVYTESDLRSADEVFLSGTLTEVLGVVQLDGCKVGTGGVGPVTQKLYEAYSECVRSHCDGLIF